MFLRLSNMTFGEVVFASWLAVKGANACIIQFSFPNGQKINGNVSELWTIKNGKVGLYAIDEGLFKKFLSSKTTNHLKAMRSERKK